MTRLIATILMTSYLAACTAWRVQETVPQKASTVRMTLADGKRLVLIDTQVMGDSLVGFAAQGRDTPSPRVRVALLAADVQRIEGRHVDASRTALAVIGLGAVIGLVVALGNVQTTDPYH